MSDFELRGSSDFYKLSKALKAAGRTQMRKELHKGLQQGAKPLIPLARAEARRVLPHKGGLAEVVARAPMRVQVRTGARTAGVRVVVGRDRSGARRANQGVIRHPVFGNRQVWVNQVVPPDWFDRPMEHGAPIVRPELQKAVERVLDQIARGVR